MPPPSFALAMTGGSLTAAGSGVTLAVTGTTTISGADLYAEGGAALGLPELEGYTDFTAETIEATGAGQHAHTASLELDHRRRQWLLLLRPDRTRWPEATWSFPR